VTEVSNHRVQQFDSAGEYLRGWGTLGTGTDDFFEPNGVAADATGTIYVTDTRNHRVKRFSAIGEPVVTWGGRGTAPGAFALPRGIAVAVHGEIYVVDGDNHRVQVFTYPEPVHTTTWGSLKTRWGGPRPVAPEPRIETDGAPASVGAAAPDRGTR